VPIGEHQIETLLTDRVDLSQADHGGHFGLMVCLTPRLHTERASATGAQKAMLLIHFQNWAIWGRVHVEI
jgi:hypothetical protein